ncbi:MAG: hypothetical protein RLZZ127_1452 [Planctomycetota bacterium]|jgi:hypothetical protein
MDLYAAARTPEPDRALFAAPGAAFRGAPFWSWNGRLERGRLLAQLDDLAAMGMGGAHIHSRTGLSTPYLGEEFMGHVRASVDHAKAKGLLTWLYDEDRWPSGFAGGLVTADPAHRLRYLLFTPRSYAEDPGSLPGPSSRAERWRTGQGRLLGRYALRFADGRLAACRVLADTEAPAPGEEPWYAYLEVCPPTSWYNHQGPVDVLSRAAIERFIAVTHDAYARAVGDEFGRSIPAIFTDEPLFTGKTFPTAWDDRADQFLPWTDDLTDTLRAAHGLDIVPVIPALFFDGLAGTERIRWAWHDHLAERFRQAFAEPIGAWCAAHGILMTGHLESEESLTGQNARNGECMRFYQPMQLPGVDMLCDALEFSTVLQARSVARQEGRAGVMSELYGVTNWDFDFTGHKRQGDWQAALGVTLRVHHLAWYSMAGEAKRDYPAAIDGHSPWFREYPLIEDHFARLNTCLARGRARARVAIVHPIESVWLAWGQADRNGPRRQAHEDRFQAVIRWLLHDLIDADFIAESLLFRQDAAVVDGRLRVGACIYDAVLVPGLDTIRATTLDLLERLPPAAVAFLGAVPELVDAVPSPRAVALAGRAVRLPCERVPVLGWLEPLREVRVRSHGLTDLLHQFREDGTDRWLFVCRTARSGAAPLPWERPDAPPAVVELRGRWRCESWDTLTGTVRDLPVTQRDGWSGVAWDAPAAGSVLLRWRPAAEVRAAGPAAGAAMVETGAWESGSVLLGERGRLPPPWTVELAEPNALVLDRPEGRLDGGAWEPAGEVLALDNRWRARLGWGPITSRIAQPWAEPAGPADHRVTLRFRIRAEVAVAAPRLALERAGEAVLRLDGAAIPLRIDGCYVDADIPTVALPDLAVGDHVLEIDLPYGRDRTLERAYLLGAFGVRVHGDGAVITALPTTWTWGDLTMQGLPFYGGNAVYRGRFDHSGGPLALRVPVFRAPLLRVALDGRDRGPLALPPYQLDLGAVDPGRHELAITCFGDRWATFGQFHHAQPGTNRWWGPDSFRSRGDQWCEEYALKPHGILVAPILIGTP